MNKHLGSSFDEHMLAEHEAMAKEIASLRAENAELKNCPKCSDLAVLSACLLQMQNAGIDLTKQLAAREADLAVAEETLKVVAYVDRSRGYPTGKEWMELITVVKAALSRLSEHKKEGGK